MKWAGALDSSCIHIMADFFYLTFSADETYIYLSDFIIASGSRNRNRGDFFLRTPIYLPSIPGQERSPLSIWDKTLPLFRPPSPLPFWLFFSYFISLSIIFLLSILSFFCFFESEKREQSPTSYTFYTFYFSNSYLNIRSVICDL